MQKKILINLLVISLCGIILSTVILFVVQTSIARDTAEEMSVLRLDFAEDRLRINEQQAALLKASVKEDYLARARALSMIISLDPDIPNNKIKLAEVARTLDVDEVHIIDENGILRNGTHPQYYGMDFATTEQTSPFLEILRDPTVEIAQEPMPNGSNGTTRQYAGVSLRGQRGIAQIGMVPERLDAALKSTQIKRIIGDIVVGNTGYIFAVDPKSYRITAHPNPIVIGTKTSKRLNATGLLDIDGQTVLYYTRVIQHQLVVSALPIIEIYSQRAFSTSFFLVFMMCLLSTFCNIVNFYIKKNVVTGINDIADSLGDITRGNLDTVVNVRMFPEFIMLSDGINHMLSSIKAKISEIEGLSESSERLAAIVAVADAGIVIKDSDNIIIEWNVGAEKMFGYKTSEMIGETEQIYVSEDCYDELLSVEERVRNGEHIAHFDVVRLHKNETLVYCSASLTPIYNKDGIFDGSVIIFHDMTKVKLAEQKARNLSAIVAIADAGIVVKDIDGVVLEWNVGAENILGFKPEEIIGNTTHNYAPKSSYSEIDNIESRLKTGENIVRVDVLRRHKNGTLIYCQASYTPIFDENGNFSGSVSVFHDISDKKQMEAALRDAFMEAEEKHQSIMSSINYASKIQQNMLPRKEDFENAFSDYSVIWKPRDVVGGDIYWIKMFKEGTVLCVCDCTGHGTPGAMLTMLVVSAFESVINNDNYKDTAEIIWGVEQKLVKVLHSGDTTGNPSNRRFRKVSDIKDGCDLAVLYIGKDGGVTTSSGNIRVFVCDGNTVNQIKGQRIFIGEGKLKSKEDINVVNIKANPDNKFYIASDGLFDQVGGEPPLPFGYRVFKETIIKNHNESQKVISAKVWEQFRLHRGAQMRRDDVQLITFKP